MNFEIKDNSDKVEKELHKSLLVALEKCGLLAEGYAKKLCPVDTGRLRNSIAHAVADKEQATYIGSNVTYAPNVELGTVHQKAQPYLHPAVARHAEEYKKIIKEALKGE